MRTIICGMGEVGRHLARDFVHDGHEVIAVDQSPDAIDDVESQLDLMTLRGHAALPNTLQQAGADRADLLVAVTDHDEVNLVAALGARQAGVKHTIARIGNRNYYTDRTGWLEGLLGVDLALCPGLLAGAEVVRFTRAVFSDYVENFAGNLVQVMVTEVREDASAQGQAPARLHLPDYCRLLAVIRDGASQPPEGISRLQPEDLVVIAGPAHDLQQAEDLFIAHDTHRGHAIVVGGGDMGQNVASELGRLMRSVTLVERNHQKCERLAEALDVVQPVHGDGTNLAFLEELGTQHAQTFVATTHEDEVNLMGTLLSKRLGAKQAIALLHRADYAGVYEALGIDATVSPRLLVSREVMRFVRRQKELIQSTIPTDGSAVFEVQVTAESALRDRRLFDQDLPHGAVTAAVTRGRALLHDPELVTLVEGDVVVVYAPDRVAAGTRRILTRRN